MSVHERDPDAKLRIDEQMRRLRVWLGLSFSQRHDRKASYRERQKYQLPPEPTKHTPQGDGF